MEVETPPMTVLSDQQTEIVKNTWSIVNETVRNLIKYKILL